jgi:hypothetical protein
VSSDVKSHSSGTWVIYIAGLVVLGLVAWWVITTLLGILFKLFLIALVVGGAFYLVGRSRRRVGGGGRRSIR